MNIAYRRKIKNRKKKLKKKKKTSSEDEDERRLQHVFKTSSPRRMFAGLLQMDKTWGLFI